MAVCESCGESILIPNKVLGHTLCFFCAKALNVKEWKDKTFYESNEEVIGIKNNVILSATKAGIGGEIIQVVTDHFDSLIEEGLLYRFKGGEAQTIKVYKDYCKIITEDYFDEDDVSRRYARSMQKGVSLESIFSDGTVVKALTMGLLSKKSLVKTGISLASSFAINSAIDYCFPGKEDVFASPGTKTIHYGDCEDIKFMRLDRNRDDSIGVIKFILTNSKELNFFYSYNEKKAIHVCETITEIVEEIKEGRQTKEKVTANLVGTSTVADEILKFKNLLDMGAISQKEFDKKKKELLNL